VLYNFTGVNGDGSNPQAALISDNAGNLYGTTFSGGGTGCGGSGCGTVFKLSKSGTVTVLYSFKGGSDGADPFSALIRDASGNLYGDTYVGGDDTCPAGGCGIVYKIDSAGNETILHSFTGVPMGEALISLPWFVICKATYTVQRRWVETSPVSP